MQSDVNILLFTVVTAILYETHSINLFWPMLYKLSAFFKLGGADYSWGGTSVNHNHLKILVGLSYAYSIIRLIA